MTRRRFAQLSIGLIVAVACLARFVHLNADPWVPNWVGYVLDEGRWNEMARHLALFGEFEGTSGAKLQLFLAPGYQAINYVLFRLLGVDFWSARLLSAACGALMLVTVFVVLRRHVTTFALALGAVVLGFESSMLWESRMALPEIPAVFASLLAFLVLVLGPFTLPIAFVAGIVAAVAAAMKATTLMVMPAFVVIALTVPRGSPFRARARRALVFVAGFMLVAAAGAAIELTMGQVKLEILEFFGSRLTVFVGLTTPYVAAMRFLDSSELEACNVLLAGVWFCSWIWLYRDRNAPAATVNLYIASAAWAAWWLLVWSTGRYLPGRYVVHWIVPATIHVMAGLSLYGRDTLDRISGALRERKGSAKWMACAWLALPTAILFAPLLAALAATAVPGLLLRAGSIAVLTAVLTLTVRHWERRPLLVKGFLFFPVVMTLAWLAGRELGVVSSFWEYVSNGQLVRWFAIAALAFAASLLLARREWHPQAYRLLQAAVVATLGAIFAAQSAAALVWPTYSIRDASIALKAFFPPGSQVRTFAAESLFLANAIRFRAVAPRETQYDGIVVFEHGFQSRYFFTMPRAANLVRVAEFPIIVNPRYVLDSGTFGPASVGVYRPK
jgi:hypothetical protein